jgi:hypothetical protein
VIHVKLLPRAGLAVALALLTVAFAAPAASAYLYWTDNGPGLANTGTTIGRANVDASGRLNALVGTASGPSAIMSDGRHIYWTNDVAGVRSIARAGIDGGAANPAFISGPATSSGVYGIATDGTYLYWTDGSEYVGRANLDGTGVAAHFIDMGFGTAPFGIAASGGVLYVGEVGQIARVPATGGASPTVLTTISGQVAMSLAVAGGYVYWSQNVLADPNPNGAVGRVQLTGAGKDETYVSGIMYPTGIATDGNTLYWVDATNQEIGRATIGSGGATSRQDDFIVDTGGPEAVALDSAIDPTHTSVTCNPPSATVGALSACTAVVSDSASTSAPAGSVVFATGGTTYFSGGNSCTLSPRIGGGASCTVAAASSAAGVQSLTASYSGDPVHSASSGSGQFCAGTSTQCGGSGPPPPPPPAPRCKVPKLRGKSLPAARKLLLRAHCRLGKVVRPRVRTGRLVVKAVRPRPGTSRPNGAKIEIWLRRV